MDYPIQIVQKVSSPMFSKLFTESFKTTLLNYIEQSEMGALSEAQVGFWLAECTYKEVCTREVADAILTWFACAPERRHVECEYVFHDDVHIGNRHVTEHAHPASIAGVNKTTFLIWVALDLSVIWIGIEDRDLEREIRHVMAEKR